METWLDFSRIQAMTKISKELFTSTLNGIVDSAQYAYSTPVVLRNGLNDQSRHMKINETVRNNQRMLRLLGSKTQT